MGVYINMEMPKDKAVAVVIHPDGTAYTAEMFAGVCTKYLSDCTAVPIPPHGRLIDADALEVRKHEKEAYDEVVALHKQKRFDATYEYYRGYSDGLITASGLVRFAPTIIPSEEGKNAD